jgi:hypothetical protein
MMIGKLGPMLSAWPIFVLAAIAIAVSIQAVGCNDKCDDFHTNRTDPDCRD